MKNTRKFLALMLAAVMAGSPAVGTGMHAMAGETESVAEMTLEGAAAESAAETVAESSTEEATEITLESAAEETTAGTDEELSEDPVGIK